MTVVAEVASPRRLRRIMRLKAVIEATGLSRSAIYAGIAAETFPAPVPLGLRSVGWIEDEIAEWQARRVAQRENPTEPRWLPLQANKQRRRQLKRRRRRRR